MSPPAFTACGCEPQCERYRTATADAWPPRYDFEIRTPSSLHSRDKPVRKLNSFAILPLLLLSTGASLAADPPIPGAFQGFTILDTYRDEGTHRFGDPDDFISAQKPLRLKLAGVGKCKIKVAFLDEDAKDVLASDTAEVTLPSIFTVPFPLPNFGGKHNGAYNIRNVRVSPAGAPCAGKMFTTKVSVAGASMYSVFAPTTPLTTQPLRIAYDGQPGDNTLKLRANPALAGTHPPCSMSAMVHNSKGYKKTFEVTALSSNGLTEVKDVDKHLAGITSGDYMLVLKGEEKATCRGVTTGPLTVKVVKPALARVVPKQFHFESGKPQSLTVEGTFPADKSVKCDLDVRLYTRPIDSTAAPRVNTVKLDDVPLPYTIESAVFKGGAGRFPTIIGDTLTHVVVKAGGACEGEATTDFGVMTVPKTGQVIAELPKPQGLKQMYTKISTVSYTVIPPPAYGAQGIACCEVETYRLDESNAWVRFKTLTGAVTLDDLTTKFANDTKPTLVRLRGYRNGWFMYWSDPVVIRWP